MAFRSKLVSDNGSQFSGKNLLILPMHEWDFSHITSTHPQSSELVEKSVHIAKQLLKNRGPTRCEPKMEASIAGTGAEIHTWAF